MVCRPLVLKGRGTPLRLRVPSGKISPASFLAAKSLPKASNCGTASCGRLRSISTEPLLRRLIVMLGIPPPNSFLPTKRTL